MKKEPAQINPNFKPKLRIPMQQQQQFQQFKKSFAPQQQNNKLFSQKPEPMDVDKSSMHVNVGKPEKRPITSESNANNPRKFQKINLMEAEESEEQQESESDEIEERQDEEGEVDEETSSIFLDN